MIPYGRQEIVQEDIDAVTEILQSDFLTQGPTVPRFEQAIAEYCHAKSAIAFNSATSALHIACLALDLKAGDWLWTTPISFVASANCGLYCGANIDFVDIDSKTYNICPKALERKLEQAQTLGRLPKVVVVVHLCGQSCDMTSISTLAHKFGFKVIEDASHAIGGKYQKQPIGNCRHSDITVFSFHPVKIITTAEGGVATTNSPALAEKLRLLRSHGITRDEHLMTHKPDGPWYYQQLDLGFNYRMTDLQAALGLSQFSRLDQYVIRRHEIADEYNSKLAKLPLILPWQHQDSYSAYHLYVVRLRLDAMSHTHRDVFEALREQGVGVNLHYIPIHLQPYYRKMGFEVGDFPNAEAYYAEAISLPMYSALTKTDQSKVIKALEKIVAK